MMTLFSILQIYFRLSSVLNPRKNIKVFGAIQYHKSWLKWPSLIPVLQGIDTLLKQSERKFLVRMESGQIMANIIPNLKSKFRQKQCQQLKPFPGKEKWG